MTFYDLWEKALAVPQLGGGGQWIAPRLVEYGSQVAEDQCIVEVGPFLGAATVYLAIGSWLGQRPVIHSYDRWEISRSFLDKLRVHKKHLKVTKYDDLLAMWKHNVGDFPADIVPHKGDARAGYDSPSNIGLFVDDCTSGTERFESLFNRFEDGFVDGAKIVMMDYGFALKRDDERFHSTVDYFEMRSDVFGQPVKIGPKDSTAVVFTYRRG